MFIKRFVVKSLPRAMSLIREELGSDAIILSSRKIRASGIMGLFGRMNFEVVAAVDDRGTADPGTSPTAKGKLFEAEVGSVRDISWLTADSGTVETETAVSGSETGGDSKIARELADIRRLLTRHMQDDLNPGASRPEAVVKLIEAWQSTSLSSSLVNRFVERHVRSLPAEAADDTVRLAVSEFVGEALSPALPPRTIREEDRVVALIGPTGVGKTTTVAKLVAHSKLKEGRRVGLLTLDTFRVAAAEQLRTYAGILNVPFAVAHTQAEVKTAMENLAECDLVYIDTAGRSFLSPENVAETRALLDELTVDVTYLVISLTARAAEAGQVAKTLDAIGYDALLFTKSDEALMPSLAVSLADAIGKPLSYVTTGQRVPDDITVANVDWFLPRMTGGGELVRSS